MTDHQPVNLAARVHVLHSQLFKKKKDPLSRRSLF